jgi:hypothetical protein
VTGINWKPEDQMVSRSSRKKILTGIEEMDRKLWANELLSLSKCQRQKCLKPIIICQY